MLLRKVSNLESGMHVRIQSPADDVPRILGVSEVIPNGGPFGRSTLRLYELDGDERYGWNVFPDDLVEIIL